MGLALPPEIHHSRLCLVLVSTWHYHKALCSLREKTFEMSARMCRKTHVVKLIQKVIPLVSQETSFVRMSASLFLVSTYLIWILGSKLILSKLPMKSNPVGKMSGRSIVPSTSISRQFESKRLTVLQLTRVLPV